MVAVAQWMFAFGADMVCLHPDGIHAKEFNIRAWLEKVAERGTTRDAEGVTGAWLNEVAIGGFFACNFP